MSARADGARLRRLVATVGVAAAFTACGIKGPEQWRKSDCEKAGEEACVEYEGQDLHRCVARYVYDCGQVEVP